MYVDLNTRNNLETTIIKDPDTGLITEVGADQDLSYIRVLGLSDLFRWSPIEHDGHIGTEVFIEGADARLSAITQLRYILDVLEGAAHGSK